MCHQEPGTEGSPTWCDMSFLSQSKCVDTQCGSFYLQQTATVTHNIRDYILEYI